MSDMFSPLRMIQGGRRISQRLEGLRDRARRGAQAKWRLEVRKAATQRMRSLLSAIASRVLLSRGSEAVDGSAPGNFRQQVFEELQQCEALEVGILPFSGVAEAASVEPFPHLAEELELARELQPSWLGVRFKPVPQSLGAGRRLPKSASLLAAVYPDSPAHEAELKASDIVLGPPGQSFKSQGQPREWT